MRVACGVKTVVDFAAVDVMPENDLSVEICMPRSTHVFRLMYGESEQVRVCATCNPSNNTHLRSMFFASEQPCRKKYSSVDLTER